MSRRHLVVLTIFLVSLGLGVFAYKVNELGFPLRADTRTPVWNLEVQIGFQAGEGSAKVGLFVPASTENFLVTDEHFVSEGFGVSVLEAEGNRKATWAIRRAKGRQLLFYKATVREVPRQLKRQTTKQPAVQSVDLTQAERAAASALISEARERSADVEGLVAELVRRIHLFEGDPNVTLLLGKRPTEALKVASVVKLLNLAEIPARVVHGVQLVAHQRRLPVQVWFEVWEKGHWDAYDPLSGHKGIAGNFLPWWRGDEPLASVTGGGRLDVQLSVADRIEEAMSHAIVAGETKAPMLLRFSLFALPIHAQVLYRILLLLPVGALFVALARNLIGVNTFGTFLPVLVALSFRETGLVAGLVFFTVILALGLLVRFYLEQLKLLLVPRLAAILTVVVLLMVVVSIISHLLGIERGLSVALFPMVILAMMIERMSVVWDELGARSALTQAIGTMVVASITYFIVASQQLEHLVFVFPELLLVVLAALILLGRYSGYRLTELFRFRDLAADRG